MILMDDPTLIGVQIRQRRNYRQLSLETLAGLTGLSKSYLSMVENGSRTIGRRAHLVAIAAVLQCSTDELQGRPVDSTDPLQVAALAAVPTVRETLVSLHLGAAPSTARALAEVRVDLDAFSGLRRRADFADTLQALPNLLLDLAALRQHADPAVRREAGRAFVDTAAGGAFTLKHIGQGDLALRAADLAHAAAVELGEPDWLGAADFVRLNVLPPESRVLAGQLAVAAADRLADQLDAVQPLHAYGMLHLTAALNAAVAERRGDVEAHLVEARMAAGRAGDAPSFAHLSFSPTNVGFWEVAIAVELGDAGRAIEIGSRLRPERVESPTRRAAYSADLARALHLARRDDEAVTLLRRAVRLAPERIKVSPQAREDAADMLRRARRAAGGRPLRDLARQLSVA
jgi:transcriptional regulator with XRE-family HTH domain